MFFRKVRTQVISIFEIINILLINSSPNICVHVDLILLMLTGILMSALFNYEI